MMERKNEWEVGGFQFGSEKDVELAKTEQEKIAYLEKRIQYDHPESVLSVYNKAVENRIFQTPVGFQFLQRLHDFLSQKGLGEQAKSIPLYQVYSYDPKEEVRTHTAKRRVQPSQYRELRSKLRKSVILNLLLLLMVAAMFAITLTSDHPNILNYEKVLTNRYAGWEQELTEREKAVRERERALHMGDTSDMQPEDGAVRE
ncbi:MAG: hypothetical protein J6C33_05705 [Lachnospiraceae bacterium]|nr:hypothetical protein [Lachnospiraceae bacterium]